MNVDQLRAELEIDEGVKIENGQHVTYMCSADRLTFGIGHLVLPDEPEYNQPVGTPVGADRVTECFDRDVGTVIEESKRLYPQFDNLPEEVKLIICNMLFNLGLPTLSKFKDMQAAINDRLWDQAADAMADSRWARQLPNRSGRLIERMRAVV